MEPYSGRCGPTSSCMRLAMPQLSCHVLRRRITWPTACLDHCLDKAVHFLDTSLNARTTNRM
uniref:Uncharacterized protein n=1 Tax=Hyaloperonospora arabidopsidis (strain Emoy2) TaxID=559515 RepID=M4C2E8_HYAAE